MNIDSYIRRVPDFPQKGILFYDVTSILTVPEAFAWVVDEMVKRLEGRDFDCIIPVESRGFIFAGPVAEKLNKPMVLARKKGKLPAKTISCDYALEYGTATLEIQTEDITKFKRVVLIDDLLATGGTLEAVVKLVKSQNIEVEGVCGVIGLPFLNYADKLKGIKIDTLIDYQSEKMVSK